MKCTVYFYQTFLSSTIATYYIVEIKKLTALVLEPKTFMKKREIKNKKGNHPKFFLFEKLA